MKALIEKALNGNRRAIARLISQVERATPTQTNLLSPRDLISAENSTPLPHIISQIYPHTGNAHIIGITGSPGTGKSTLVNAIAKQLRTLEQTVGIIAVDPSSPFTGGALLGDRIRMSDLYGDKGIFIRSMASRGSLGGLARATANITNVMDACGFDVVLIETVGAGQAEVDIARLAHTTLVIEAPGLGDDIQSIKAGILEIADILVVNKADRPGKDSTVRALRAMLQLGHSRSLSRSGDGAAPWQTPIVETAATLDKGITTLVEKISAHKIALQESAGWAERLRLRSQDEVEGILTQVLMRQVSVGVSAEKRHALITEVAERRLDPYTAVDQLRHTQE